MRSLTCPAAGRLAALLAVTLLVVGCSRHEETARPDGPGADAGADAGGRSGTPGAATGPEEAAAPELEAVRGLIKDLAHEDAVVRGEAAVALSVVGVPAAVEILAELTNPGRDAAFRRKAVSLLGGIASKDDGAPDGIVPAIVAALVGALGDEDPSVREAAARALARPGGEGAEALMKALAEATARSSPYEERRRLIEALGRSGRAGVPAVLKLAGFSVDFNLRASVARAIRRMGPEAVAAVVAMHEQYPSRETVSLLEEIGPGARPSLAAVVKLVDDPRPKAREGALAVLAKIGPGASEAVPALLGLMRKATGPERAAAARAVVEIDPGNAEALEVFLSHLTSKGSGAVLKRVGALAELGPAGEKGMPFLIALLRDKSVNTRIVAADAILRIRPGSTSPVHVLIAELDGKLDLQAARLLGIMGPSAKSAVPKLIRELEGRDWPLMRVVARALAGIGPAAVPELTKALGHEATSVRGGAAIALGMIGPEAKGALGALEELAKAEGRLGSVAREAVGKIRSPRHARAEPDIAKLWERSRQGADRRAFVEGLRRAVARAPGRAAERARELGGLKAAIPDPHSRRLVELAAINVLVAGTDPAAMSERVYLGIRHRLDALRIARGKAPADANMACTELAVLDHRHASDEDRRTLVETARRTLGARIVPRDGLWPDTSSVLIGRASTVLRRAIREKLAEDLGLTPEEAELPARREFVKALEEVGAPKMLIHREKRALRKL